jgi:molybdopterin biosynthesis enzyme
MLSGLSQANCLIIVPEQVEAMNAGDSVQAIQLD